MTDQQSRASPIGEPMTRREDHAFLTGSARYTADVSKADTCHLAFARSQHANADITAIDVDAARSMTDVHGVYTFDALEASGLTGRLPISTAVLDHDVPGHPILADGVVRYHGQPIVAVVASDPYTASDAIDAVSIEYDRREPVIDPTDAADDTDALVYASLGTNVAVDTHLGDAEETARAFERADHQVDIELENNRLIPSAIEPRAALAEYDASSDRYTVTMTSQSPHGHRSKLAQTLEHPEHGIRVIAPAVGGGFGHKGHHHPGEAMAAWCAKELGRPIKWVATRSENYLAGAHGRDHRTDARLAFDGDGRIRGLEVETVANVGAYGLGGSAGMASRYGGLLSGQYRIPAISCSTTAVFTNTAPVHSYRGAGRPEAIYVIERLVDRAARSIDMDVVDFRRRNMIEPTAFPYETAVGARYDSGSYERALDVALEAIDYPPDLDRDDDRFWGVGIACYVESTGGGFESGLVRVHADGTVTAYAGSHSHGQGHETTYAQLIADVFQTTVDRITVIEGDSDAIPAGVGTFGSRSAISAGNAVVESARNVLEKAREIAAYQLEADVDDIEYADGTFTVRGVSDHGVSFDEVARRAHGWNVPDHLEPGLDATTFFEPDGTAYTFGTHVAIVAIDAQTGRVDIERYVAVDDCGPRINPMIVEGQVHGGVAQGVGQARFERTVYDDVGNLVSGTLESYAVPKSTQLVNIETDSTVTESPGNPLGVKGIGEAGTIAAPPAVINAVVDALEPLEIDHIDMPVDQEQVWKTIAERT